MKETKETRKREKPETATTTTTTNLYNTNKEDHDVFVTTLSQFIMTRLAS